MDLAIALVVLVLLLVAMVWLVVASNVASAGIVLLLSMLWVLVNKPVEGSVLLPITAANGITSSDLLSGLGVFLVLAAVTRRASRRPERVRPASRRTGSRP
jgi:FtsH-binding integral membrane protein